MFALRAVDNSTFWRRIDGPRLAPTYDIHVSFNPSLLGGVFNRSSLNLQLVEMRPVEALPSCKVNGFLAPSLQLMIDQVQDDGNSMKEDDLLRELKEVSRLIDTQSVLPTLPVFDSHHHCAMNEQSETSATVLEMTTMYDIGSTIIAKTDEEVAIDEDTALRVRKVDTLCFTREILLNMRSKPFLSNIPGVEYLQISDDPYGLEVLEENVEAMADGSGVGMLWAPPLISETIPIKVEEVDSDSSVARARCNELLQLVADVARESTFRLAIDIEASCAPLLLAPFLLLLLFPRFPRVPHFFILIPYCRI